VDRRELRVRGVRYAPYAIYALHVRWMRSAISQKLI
jgi:hypothetical protein